MAITEPASPRLSPLARRSARPKSTAGWTPCAADRAARLAVYPALVSFHKLSDRTSPQRLGGTADAKGAVAAVFDPSASRKGVLERVTELFTGPRRRDVPLVVRIPEDGVARSL